MFGRSKEKKTLIYVTTVDSCLATYITQNTMGSELFNQVCCNLGIIETQWFGLSYTDLNDCDQWLLSDDKIDMKKVKRKSETASHFEFKIRCYPECSKRELCQDVVKIYFFKEGLIQMITDPDWTVTPEELVCASVAYICLVEHENASLTHEEILETRLNRILTTKIMDQHGLSMEDWKKAISSSLETAKTLIFTEPILQCLTIFEQSPLYGVTYFPIINKKQTKLLIGVDCFGVNIYRRSDRCIPAVAFTWAEIAQVCHDGKIFQVKLTDKNIKPFNFYCESAVQGRMMVIAVECNHKLYKQRRSTAKKPDTDIRNSLAISETEKEKKFAEIKQSQCAYTMAAESLIKGGYIDQEKYKQFEEKFEEARSIAKLQLDDVTSQVESYIAKRSDAETLELKVKAKNLKDKLVQDTEFKERAKLFEDTLDERTNSLQKEVKKLVDLIAKLEIQHQEDKKKIEELSKVQKPKEKEMEEPQKPENIALIPYDEAKNVESEELKKKIRNFGDFAKKRDKDTKKETNLAMRKFDTLNKLQKVSTRDRVDEFEALI